MTDTSAPRPLGRWYGVACSVNDGVKALRYYARTATCSHNKVGENHQ